MKPPRVQYAASPEGKIAYQVLGDGPVDLVYSSSTPANLDAIWEYPPLERFLRRLGSFSRLILFNPRGIGLSDPIPLDNPPVWEEWSLDINWVLDSVESEGAAFLAAGISGLSVMAVAATSPERTKALALVDCFARLRRDVDYPWGFPPEALEKRDALVVGGWGNAPGAGSLAPGLSDDDRFRDWLARSQRGYMSQTMMAVSQRFVSESDVRGILPSIKAPTLVISHAEHPWIRAGHSRYLADHIPGARYVERPGFSGLDWFHDADWMLDEVQTFFTGTRGEAGIDDRVLATILFSDIVGSTNRAAEIGDQRWRYLLDEHDAIARREIERFRGRWVKSTGDGLLATFDGPARAIRCARALADAVRPLGIEVRTGLHAGEVELRDDDVGGIAVHIAARVMGEAGAGEVLVSGSVPPLVAGSGIDFEDLGTRALKGVPGEWQLFAVRN